MMAPFLADGRYGLCLLDGGTGHLLKARLGHGNFVQTCAAAHREALTAVHRDYWNAGASAVTTNTYAATPHHLAKVGKAGQVTEVCRTACKCAREAAPRVIGSLPPLGESYVPASDELVASAAKAYGDMLEGMGDADGLLVETMVSSREAAAAAVAARTARPSAPLVVSTSSDADYARAPTLRGGEPLLSAVRAVDAACISAGVAVPDGYGVNCTDAETVLRSVRLLRAALPRPRIVACYCNVFPSPTSAHYGERRLPLKRIKHAAIALLRWVFRRRTTGMSPAAFGRHAVACARAGADVVGGCCGAGPAHIARAAEELVKARV